MRNFYVKARAFFLSKDSLQVLNSSKYIFLLLTISLQGFAQPGPVLEWQKRYGGPSADEITSWIELEDGYLLGGGSGSGIGFEKTEATRGGYYDYWVVKVDKSGNKIWDKTFGGSGYDHLQTILKAPDGFLLCGWSDSEISGDKTQASRGYTDFWIVKISPSGIKIWDKTLGGDQADILESAVTTPDGGFLLGGTSESGISGEKSEASRTLSFDYWVVKINTNGSKVWDKTYGGQGTSPGMGNEELFSIVPASDGGYLLGGHSDAQQGFEKSENGFGMKDIWIVKINESGGIVWDKTYGSEDNEEFTEIIPAPDGGFIVAGMFSDWGTVSGAHQFITGSIQARKINAQGQSQWVKTFSPLNGQTSYYVASIGANATGFAYLYQELYSESEYFLTKFNWQGNLQYHTDSELTDTESGKIIRYNSAGEMFLGYMTERAGARSADYGLKKYKPETSNHPSLSMEFEEKDSDKTLLIYAYPNYFTSPVAKVEFYINGSKAGEDNTAPYSYNWTNKTPGDHSIKTVAITTNGQKISSAEIKWKNFRYSGFQAEQGFVVTDDSGRHPVSRAPYATLSGGSSVKLWDIGDKAKFKFFVPRGTYFIKVRLRSGYYTSTYSNNKAYWPDGYSFWIDGISTKFTGDPASISAKDPSYGNSYWGTMISSPVYIPAVDYSHIEIRANKQWLGIDYIELVPASNLMEAEEVATPLYDPGTRQIGEVKSSSFSGGSSLSILDRGDAIAFNFSVLAGYYVIKARVRSGYYTSTGSYPYVYWPNGYSFQLNDGPIPFTGDRSTVSGKVTAYGNSYWGTMNTEVIYLPEGHHQLNIIANAQWLGVDYLEIVPVQNPSARIAAPENILAGNKSVYPNPFNNIINVVLPEAFTKNTLITLVDAFGKIVSQETTAVKNENTAVVDLSGKHLHPGLYFVKVKTAAGEKIYRVQKE